MHRILLPSIAALVLTGLLAVLAPTAQAMPVGYAVRVVHSGLNSPVAIRFAPDGRLFYLERSTGRIMVYASSTSPTPTVWATLPVDNSSEHGLLGMAFHPSFPDSPYVYFYHTNPSPYVNRVVRLKDLRNTGVNLAVIVDGLPAASVYHQSGRLAFGPDRMLYITFGDQTDPQYAENTTNVRGKVLRVTPLGVAPADNPFGAGNPAWAMGIRNAFGLCFDPVAGTGYFTENGPDCDDEVNLLVRGGDYGWGPNDPCGSQPAGTLTALRSFTPTIAPTGCCVYRSTSDPQFNGNLFFGSYNEGAVMRMAFHPGAPGQVDLFDRTFISLPGELVLDVTMGPEGLLWFSTSTSIEKLVPNALLGVGDPPAMAGFTARPNPFTGSLTLSLPPAIVIDRLDILDVGGRHVRGWSGPLRGTLVWNGTDDSGERTPPGVYFARLTSAAGTVSRRLVRLVR